MLKLQKPVKDRTREALAIALFVIVGSLILDGCQMNSAPSSVDPSNLTYFQDSKTEVCYAAMNSYHDGTYQTTITYVPCTPKVLAAIKK